MSDEPTTPDQSKLTVWHAKGQKRWALIKEDFMAQNLKLSQNDPMYTLKDCAAAWGISYAVIRQKAGQQKWIPELRERIERLRQEAQQRLHEVALFDELEIRTRQATYARLASSVAYQKLQSLDDKAIERMSIKDAVELLKIGLGEERQALGIGDTVRTPPTDGEKAVLSEKQVFAVARRVLEMRKQDDGCYVQRDPATTEEQPAAPDDGGAGGVAA